MLDDTYPIKLVRDKIGSAYPHEARIGPMHVGEPGGPGHIKALRAKLVEEAAEYLIDPTTDELADLIEVIAALAEHDLHLGGDQMTALDRVLVRAWEKREERGGFDRNIHLAAFNCRFRINQSAVGSGSRARAGEPRLAAGGTHPIGDE